MSAPGSSWTSPPRLQVRVRMALRRRQNLRQVPWSTTISKRGSPDVEHGVVQNL